MAYIDRFRNGLDRYDLPSLRDDLRERIVNDYVGEENSIPFRDIVDIYFDTRPALLEEKLLLERLWQEVKRELEGYDNLVDVHRRHRFLVKTTEEAERCVIRRSRWEVRRHERLVETGGSAVRKYNVLPSHPVIKAIEGATPQIDALREAVKLRKPIKPLELPLGEDDRESAP